MKLRVSGSDIKVTKDELIVTEAENCYTLEFQFDKTWNSMVNKTAVLYQPTVNRENPMYMIIDESNKIKIPLEVLVAEDYLYIGVFGFSEDGEVRLPTIYTYTYVRRGCYKRDEEPVPDPSVYEQIYRMALKAVTIALGVQERADSGEFDGFSPEITVAQDTPFSYVLHIKTEDDEFDTPNLKGEGSGINNVVEGYFNPEDNLFYREDTYETPIEGSDRVIYISLDTNDTYRYNLDEEIFVRLDESEGSGSLQKEITASIEVGGINAGDNFPVGTSYDAMWDALLNPTLYPILTNPSASLASTGAKLLEKGATLSTVFTATFNRGTINPAYGTSGYRSGVATGYILNAEEEQSGNTWNITVDENCTSYKVVVKYAEGEQPKDSSGKNYESPLPAGSVTSNNVTYEFVNAIYANTSSAGVMTKQALVSKSAKSKQLSLAASTVANPEQIDIPGSWTVTKIEVLNTLSGKWEDATSQFTKTTTSHDDAASRPTSYNRYTCNLGMALGARDVRVLWS